MSQMFMSCEQLGVVLSAGESGWVLSGRAGDF